MVLFRLFSFSAAGMAHPAGHTTDGITSPCIIQTKRGGNPFFYESPLLKNLFTIFSTNTMNQLKWIA
jgi:hypothetical protein